MRKLLALSAALPMMLLGIVVGGGSARAVVPGENGRIVFARCIHPFKCGSDTRPTWELVAANPDDSDEIVLAGPYPRSVWDDHFIANWSPDASSAIFMAQLGARQAIWQVKADGTDLHKVFTAPRGTGLDDGPAFTPDGEHIIFTRCCPPSTGYALWSIRANGTGLKPVTDESVPPGVDGPSDNLPQVAPNGARITYHRNVVTCADPSTCGNRIVTVNINGGNRVQLTDPKFEAQIPNWSPDGKQIVFEMYPPKGGGEVGIVNADGTGFHRVTSGGGITYSFAPSFSPDGTKIIFTRAPATGGGTDLFTMNPDGSDVARLARTAAIELWPQWATA